MLSRIARRRGNADPISSRATLVICRSPPPPKRSHCTTVTSIAAARILAAPWFHIRAAADTDRLGHRHVDVPDPGDFVERQPGEVGAIIGPGARPTGGDQHGALRPRSMLLGNRRGLRLARH